MDELVSQIQQRTGIDEAQARTAAETAINFIKERLPAPIAGQVDSVVGGGGGGSGAMGGLGDLGGLNRG